MEGHFIGFLPFIQRLQWKTPNLFSSGKWFRYFVINMFGLPLGVYDLDDLSSLLIKLGVTNPELRCSDNMVLSELTTRLGKLRRGGEKHVHKLHIAEQLGSESTTPSSRALTSSASLSSTALTSSASIIGPRPPQLSVPKLLYNRRKTVLIVSLSEDKI